MPNRKNVTRTKSFFLMLHLVCKFQKDRTINKNNFKICNDPLKVLVSPAELGFLFSRSFISFNINAIRKTQALSGRHKLCLQNK